MTSLQSNTGVDWQAAYNFDTRNHRSIASVPVLPGQEIRSGHGHGVASSRFFSRKSLLGSSTSGVAAGAAQPPQLLTIPEHFVPRDRRQLATAQRMVDTPAARLRQSEQHGPNTRPPSSSRHSRSAQPEAASTSRQQPRAHSVPRQPSASVPSTQGRAGRQSQHHVSREAVASLRRQTGHTRPVLLPAGVSTKLDRWFEGMEREAGLYRSPTASDQQEERAPPSHHRDPPINDRRPPTSATPVFAVPKVPQQAYVREESSVGATSSTVRRELPTPAPAANFGTRPPSLQRDMFKAPPRVAAHNIATSDRTSMQAASPASDPFRSPVDAAVQIPAHGATSRSNKHFKQTDASPRTDSTSRYRSPPHSAKPSIASLASLPHLTASAQAPFGHALKGYTSDESPTVSGPSWFEGSSSETTSTEPRGQAQAARSSRPAMSNALSSHPPATIKTIKTKYGRDYERQHDRLPFEPVHVQARTETASPRASSATHNPDATSSRQPHDGLRKTGQQHRRQSKDLSAAHDELARIMEKQRAKASSSSSEEARSVEMERLGDSKRQYSSMPHPEDIERAIGRHRARNPALGREDSEDASPDSMRRPRVPDIVISDAMLDEEPVHSAALISRQARKGLISLAKTQPEESPSSEGEASQMPQNLPTLTPGVSQGTGTKESSPSGSTKDDEKRERRKKRKEKRKLISALKKPGQPSPFLPSNSRQPSPGDGLQKSVAFGDPIPAEVGGSHIPPPHSDSLDGTGSTTTESTAVVKAHRPSDGTFARSREPSPDPAQLDDNRRKRRSRHKDRAKELDNLAPPLPFDFSRPAQVPQAGDAQPDPSAGAPPIDFNFTPAGMARRKVNQTTVDDGSDDGTPAAPQPARRQRENVQRLDLPQIPEINKEYVKLPGLFLANYVKEAKGTSVYPRVRELIYDYHADLEDINKRRARFWLPLAEGCEGLVQKIRNSLYDGSCKRKVPAFHKILGSQDDPEENTIIFAKRAVTEQIKQAIAYTTEALAQYNGIVQSSNEVFDVGGALTDVDPKAREGFVHTYWGLLYHKNYFTHLYNEIALIAWVIRKVFEWLGAVPSARELQLFPQDRIEYFNDAREQLVEWLDLLLAAVRLWKGKITRQNFEKQLVPLRNLDRKWEEADDKQFGLIKNIFCFGLCLPRSIRRMIEGAPGEEEVAAAVDEKQEQQIEAFSAPAHDATRQPTAVPAMSVPQQQHPAEEPEVQIPAVLLNNPAFGDMEGLSNEEKLQRVRMVLAAQGGGVV